MDKEEIKRDLTNLSYTHNQFSTVINNALQYIQHLEQKEYILDKVTDFAYKIATENAEKYNSENQKEVDFSEWNLVIEILNIIEGEEDKLNKERGKK